MWQKVDFKRDDVSAFNDRCEELKGVVETVGKMSNDLSEIAVFWRTVKGNISFFFSPACRRNRVLNALMKSWNVVEMKSTLVDDRNTAHMANSLAIFFPENDANAWKLLGDA